MLQFDWWKVKVHYNVATKSVYLEIHHQKALKKVAYKCLAWQKTSFQLYLDGKGVISQVFRNTYFYCELLNPGEKNIFVLIVIGRAKL